MPTPSGAAAGPPGVPGKWSVPGTFAPRPVCHQFEMFWRGLWGLLVYHKKASARPGRAERDRRPSLAGSGEYLWLTDAYDSQGLDH